MTITPPGLAATGIPGLDDVLRGGLPRKRIYLLQGPPGVGKTTLGLQFLLEGRKHGESGLYVTLSESEDELQGVAASHGWNLEGLAIHQLSTPEEMLEAEAQNTLFHPAEVELNETVKRVLALVEQTQPTRIVFDSLSELRLLAGESLRYRRQILSLKQHFAGRASTVLFLDDGTSSSGDVQLQSLAHGVIALEKFSPDFGATRRRIEVVKLRGVDFRTGKHDCTIEKTGLKVFPRLIAAEHGREFTRERLPSGNAELDALLGGGVQRGTSTLLLGAAGTGKSTLASHYLQSALQRGEAVSAFLFDENVSTFFSRAASMNVDLERYTANGKLQVRQVDPAELSPGELADAVRHAVETHGSRIVVIDSLNGYLMAMPDERHLVIQMHELLAYLAQVGVSTFVVVAQHGLVGSMKTPVDLTYLADNVVLFRYFEAAGKVHKAISVLKKRIGSHEDTIREFQMDENGIRIGPPLTDFSGVLTGTPTFAGREGNLLPERG